MTRRTFRTWLDSCEQEIDLIGGKWIKYMRAYQWYNMSTTTREDERTTNARASRHPSSPNSFVNRS
jgi:hypothetical protein